MKYNANCWGKGNTQDFGQRFYYSLQRRQYLSLFNKIADEKNDLKGINAGKTRSLPNVQLGSLAALTTRYPGASENDSIIVGVFIIDSVSEGDDIEGGIVSAKSNTK